MSDIIKFSQMYLKKNILTNDTPRFRNRLYEFFCMTFSSGDTRSEIARLIKLETGSNIRLHSGGYDFDGFFKKGELRDILDAITIIANCVRGSQVRGEYWIDFVVRIFYEEELNYKIDQNGIVHYYVDEEFEQGRVATIDCLNLAEYSNAKNSYLSSHSHLKGKNQNTKSCVRDIFDAVEILFKKITKSTHITTAATTEFKRKQATTFVCDVSKRVFEKMVDQLQKWTDALHNYRHGQDAPDVVAPTIGEAVFFLSTGSSFLRWLIEIDQTNKTKYEQILT